MSWPRNRPPYSVPSAFVKSDADRKARIRAFGGRLKLVRWFVLPSNVFPDVPAYGLAIYPLSPRIGWAWGLRDGSAWISQPLVWLGFWVGDPHFPFSLN